MPSPSSAQLKSSQTRTEDDDANRTKSEISGTTAYLRKGADSEPFVERKIPTWAKLAIFISILIFLGFFFAFASAVTSGGVD